MKRFAIFALQILPAVLCGCTVGPSYRAASAPQLGVPSGYVAKDAAVAAPDNLPTWWEAFGDPTLTSIEGQAFAGNLDIAQAIARLRQARESLVQAKSDQLPSLDGSVGINRTFAQDGASRTGLSVSIDPRWSADLFGGLRRSSEAAKADYESAHFSLANVQIATAAEVARNYVDARVAKARIAIADDALRSQDDNLQIARWRAQAGLVSSLDVEQARAQRAQTAASIPSLNTAVVGAQNRLSVLTGQAPGSIDPLLGDGMDIPTAPAQFGVGLPAELLRRRPDIRQAERNLAAATARIGVAEADLYPALSLSGSIGSSAASIASLVDSFSVGLFATLAHTIFDGGRTRSRIRSQEAAADGALAAYRQTILGGLEDVENAVVARAAAAQREEQLAIQVEASSNAAIYARINYRAGLSDFRTLLDAERTLLSARDSLASAKGDSALAVIQLYLALGGGWTPEAEAA